MTFYWAKKENIWLTCTFCSLVARKKLFVSQSESQIFAKNHRHKRWCKKLASKTTKKLKMKERVFLSPILSESGLVVFVNVMVKIFFHKMTYLKGDLISRYGYKNLKRKCIRRRKIFSFDLFTFSFHVFQACQKIFCFRIITCKVWHPKRKMKLLHFFKKLIPLFYVFTCNLIPFFNEP